jgi:hypothetical protein
LNKINPFKKENKQIGYEENIEDIEVTEINQIEYKTE